MSSTPQKTLEKLKLGLRISTDKGTGEVAYVGKTKFSEGDWVGVILDEPNGKNNGSVNGETYFSCTDGYGIFIKPSQVRMLNETLTTPSASRQKSQPSGLKPPSSVKRPAGLPRPSPGGTPKISPAPSSENLTRTAARKSSSATDAKPPQPPLAQSNQPDEDEPRRDSLASTTADGENIRDKARKFDEAPQTPIVAQRQASVDPAEQTEINALQAENKELKDQLAAIKQRQKQEHLELERTKIQLETLVQFKVEMTEQHAALKRTLEEKQKDLDETLSKTIESSEGDDFMQQLELVTLDKEMAEERAELLAAEVEELKAKNQELENDLELLKAEMANAASGDGAPAANSVQLKQMESHVERYKDALVRMRDLTARTNNENTELKKQLELLQEECDAVTANSERLQRELAQAAEAINTFREQADNAMGSERMIEILTEKNLELEEKLRTTEETIEDLEQMRAMDDELMETQKDVEKDLRKELDMCYVAANELRGQLRKCDERAEDYEKVILKFRQKTNDLNEEIQAHKDEILILKNRQEQHDAGHGGSASLFASRTFSEVVDAELKALELEYAQQHVKYLKLFLPDNFTKAGGDNDSVLLTVAFPRMVAKTSALSKLLSQKYPQVPGGMRREHVTKSHRAEQWAHVKKFTYCLQSLKGILRKFESILQNCSVERLSRLSTQQLEIANQEKALDQYFELLKQGRLDENTSIDSLERVVNFFEKMYAVNLTAETFDTRDAMTNIITRFQDGVSWMQLNCQRLKFFLQPGSEDDSDVAEFVDRIVAVLTDAEKTTMRAQKLVPAEKDLAFSSEVNDEIYSAASFLEKAAKILHSICNSAASRLTMNDVDGFTATELKEMIQNAVEKAVGPMDVQKACDSITDSLSDFNKLITELTQQLDNGRLEVPPAQKKQYPPLVDRAHARKTDAFEAEGLRWQISKKESEIVELRKVIKAKNDDISSLKVRIEMADKHVEDSGKNGDAQVKHLKAKNDELLEELRKKEEEHAKIVNELQSKLDSSDKENKVLTERAKDFSKKALFANMSNALGSPQSPSVPNAATPFSQLNSLAQLNDTAIEREYNETLEALNWSQLKIWKMQAAESSRILSELKPLNPPDAVCGLHSLSHCRKDEGDAELHKMLRQCEQLDVESRRYLLEPIDPKLKARFRHDVADFNHRVETLKFQFQRFWSRTHPGEPYPRLLGPLASLAHDKGPEKKVVAQPVDPADSCRSILDKWKRELAEEEKKYGHLAQSSAC
ncbi:Protein DNC-1 e [Aphelenchoides avenae]|nr:Protein DNC-1 e [Aphelenchus avenae]